MIFFPCDSTFLVVSYVRSTTKQGWVGREARRSAQLVKEMKNETCNNRTMYGTTTEVVYDKVTYLHGRRGFIHCAGNRVVLGDSDLTERRDIEYNKELMEGFYGVE